MHSANEIYKTKKILKICDYLKLEHCSFAKEVITKTTLHIFEEYFSELREIYQHKTRHSGHVQEHQIPLKTIQEHKITYFCDIFIILYHYCL